MTIEKKTDGSRLYILLKAKKGVHRFCVKNTRLC